MIFQEAQESKGCSLLEGSMKIPEFSQQFISYHMRHTKDHMFIPWRVSWAGYVGSCSLEAEPKMGNLKPVNFYGDSWGKHIRK